MRWMAMNRPPQKQFQTHSLQSWHWHLEDKITFWNQVRTRFGILKVGPNWIWLIYTTIPVGILARFRQMKEPEPTVWSCLFYFCGSRILVIKPYSLSMVLISLAYVCNFPTQDKLKKTLTRCPIWKILNPGGYAVIWSFSNKLLNSTKR